MLDEIFLVMAISGGLDDDESLTSAEHRPGVEALPPGNLCPLAGSYKTHPIVWTMLPGSAWR
jgi:hypothetical protein